MLKKIGLGLGVLFLLLTLTIYIITEGWLGSLPVAGESSGKTIPADILTDRMDVQRAAALKAGAGKPKQILFGDLHVHTTISLDAYLMSLPIINGEGAHPPADACDFARFCSALDFWSINDHASSVSPSSWKETVQSIRQCNAVTDPKNPDVVAFLGYEWTQAGTTPENHYGHKNVIFRDLAEGKIPKRVISAKSPGPSARNFNAPFKTRIGLPLIDSANFMTYMDYNRYSMDIKGMPFCPDDVNTKDLPADCEEAVTTPAELFRKLDEGGYVSTVIPHGNTWGLYTPRGTTWDKQLKGKNQDPQRQTMIEVYSGHGNAEEYRPWRASVLDAEGKETCPEPTPSYLPGCWRAGEIVYERCTAAGKPPDDCRGREVQARADYLASGFLGSSSVPGTTLLEWQDSEQCRDCFLPAFDYRPGGSAQYALAIGNFDEPDKDGRPRRFRFGFMGASDNHFARPGTGYKEFGRYGMTEGRGARTKKWAKRMGQAFDKPSYRSRVLDPREQANIRPYGLARLERIASYFRTGGLIAVHATGRDRNSIWDAMGRKEIYATSGDRILLWFDLVNGGSGVSGGSPGEGGARIRPMGSELNFKKTPRFRVRALGALKQKPGCPEFSVNALSKEKLERLCKNECYNPSDERKMITRIEVIRIRPQIRKGEPVKELVEDVWKTHTCKVSREGCVFEFSDPSFTGGKRDVVYYVRAIQEPTPTVNGGSYRCEYDQNGRCTKMNACWANYKDKNPEDDCLALSSERAWSSPIFLDYAP